MDRRTLSRFPAASPCCRPFSFCIISSVSGPGVNPSPSELTALTSFAGVTVPWLEGAGEGSEGPVEGVEAARPPGAARRGVGPV